MRVLLDECLPKRLKQSLIGHDVQTVPEAGWAGKKNGDLIRLAAGKFDAFKVGATGGDSPLTIWVEKAAPHRLLKLAIVGQPVEFRLVK